MCTSGADSQPLRYTLSSMPPVTFGVKVILPFQFKLMIPATTAECCPLGRDNLKVFGR